MQVDQTWATLEQVLEEINYTRDPGENWERFQFEHDAENNYAVLYIFTHNVNTYNRSQIRHTRHEFVVPAVTYHEAAWARWVFDRIASIEMHETCESFEYKGVRIYAPHHGNGWDPYTIWYDGHPEEQAKAPGDD